MIGLESPAASVPSWGISGRKRWPAMHDSGRQSGQRDRRLPRSAGPRTQADVHHDFIGSKVEAGLSAQRMWHPLPPRVVIEVPPGQHQAGLPDHQALLDAARLGDPNRRCPPRKLLKSWPDRAPARARARRCRQSSIGPARTAANGASRSRPSPTPAKPGTRSASSSRTERGHVAQ